MSHSAWRSFQSNPDRFEDFEIEIGQHHGHPTLTFFGRFCTFRLGASKVRTILEHAEECQDVLESLRIWRL